MSRLPRSKFGPSADYDWPTLRWYLLVVALAFLLLLGRLFYLQVVRGQLNMKASLDNLFETVEIPAPRGEILDRAGKPLAANRNVFALLYRMPSDIELYFLTSFEEKLLLAISREDLYAMRALEPSQFSRIKAEAEAIRNEVNRLDEAERNDAYDITAEQLGLLDDNVAGQHSFLAEWPCRWFIWLANCSRNPAAYRLAAISHLRSTGTQQYTYKIEAGKGAEQKDKLDEVSRLATYLSLPYEELMQRLEKEKQHKYGFHPAVLVPELDEEQRVHLSVNADEYPGMMIERFAFVRDYPLREAAGTLLGYLGYVSESDPQSIQSEARGSWDLVGKRGAEHQYEKLLHGFPGRRDLKVTKSNRIKEVAREVAPEKGQDIYLTIDKELQYKAYQQLAGRKGGIIVCALGEGFEGEILAMASSPTFDPNRINDNEYYLSLATDNKRFPLLNRAFGQAYPPGSTFKLVTTQAGLQTAVISTGGFSCYCKGNTEIGNRRFHCHKRTGHGSLGLMGSFKESCDIAYYQISVNDLGVEAPYTIRRFAEMYGYGKPVGIDLPGEAKGLLPDPEWKRKNYAGDRWHETDRLWYQGDTANYAIGQGYMLATPLQVLWSSNVVALDGKWHPPQVLKAVAVDGKPVSEDKARAQNIALDKDVLAYIKRAMRETATDGTCRQLNIEGLSVCAKSGTAEAGVNKEDHSWVVGFYPYENPRYGFVAFYENGGGAGEAAIPAMKQILAYMKQNDPIDMKQAQLAAAN